MVNNRFWRGDLSLKAGFTHNFLDRSIKSRTDNEFVLALKSHPQTTIALFFEDQCLLWHDGYRKVFVPFSKIDDSLLDNVILLGEDDDGAKFAASYRGEVLPDGVEIFNLRQIALQSLLPNSDIGALAQAKTLLHWHHSQQYCAKCGAKTKLSLAGARRDCKNCDSQHFPRTDPVVIMLAIHEENVLLGRSAHFPSRLYSCLAGYMEPGETIEAAVRRELHEEAGVICGPVKYIASQPWPFPASLMIGCTATILDPTLTIDPHEIEDARWFNRKEVIEMSENRHNEELSTPKPLAMAHLLLRHWLNGHT